MKLIFCAVFLGAAAISFVVNAESDDDDDFVQFRTDHWEYKDCILLELGDGSYDEIHDKVTLPSTEIAKVHMNFEPNDENVNAEKFVEILEKSLRYTDDPKRIKMIAVVNSCKGVTDPDGDKLETVARFLRCMRDDCIRKQLPTKTMSQAIYYLFVDVQNWRRKHDPTHPKYTS